ncbi:MAG: hypothetical protein HY290_26910 [Planctomycetia bacterium]|nr:hypothetical protein [Planctomycetia bacterium]
MFFVATVLNVLDSLLTDRPPLNKFSHPTFFLPPYFGFAMTLLGTALLYALVSLWNTRIGLLRRWATLLLVAVALGMISADYAVIYRNLLEIFGPGQTVINPSAVVMLYQSSRLLKSAALAVSIAAAILVIWPESSGDLPTRISDPAL